MFKFRRFEVGKINNYLFVIFVVCVYLLYVLLGALLRVINFGSLLNDLEKRVASFLKRHHVLS